MIRRPTTAETGRALAAQLTTFGLVLLGDAAEVVRRLDQSAIANVGAAELAGALDVLRRVTENLRNVSVAHH